jgi:hypothetical protein
MVVATLSRGSASIELPLVESGGEILVARSFGKPEVNVRESGGTLNPRVNDRWSGIESIELVGKLFDYATVHDLTDLIKSASTDPLTLDVPLPEFPDSMPVAPAAGQSGALTVTFPAGKRDFVDVSLTVTRVSNEVTGVGGQSAQTPRASGNGPVIVDIGTDTIELPTPDLSLERSVGRPNDTVRRQPGVSDPRYFVKAKVATDVFTLSFETLENIPQKMNAIVDGIFRQRLDRDGVALDFQGLLGLGRLRVIPIGSSPFRQVRQAGRKSMINPTLELRRIFD